MPLVFLKLGGSAITDKTRAATARPEVIREAARAVRAAREHSPELAIVLGHGSGSFGHFAAQEWGFGATAEQESKAGAWRAYAETGAAAARLNRLVTDIFLSEEVPVVSLQPSASARMRDGELVRLETYPLEKTLEHGLIPLIYGDVAVDETRGMSIVSTDALFAYLAPLLKPTRIVYTTAVGGIYTADPLKEPDARPLRDITTRQFEQLRDDIGGSHGFDVTGGMRDKVRRALELARQLPSLEIFVVGIEEELLQRALLQGDLHEGTRLRASRRGTDD